MPEGWWDYVVRTAGTEATQKDIAKHTGIEQSTLSRWKLGKNPPDAKAVVGFALAYKQHPVAALIAAGYLDAKDVEGVVEIVATPMSKLSINEIVGQLRELFAELQRRVPVIRDIVDAVDDAENWPQDFSEGEGEQSAPVRRRKNR
jgi:transcriptional regulator with XRE-family HTH domain